MSIQLVRGDATLRESAVDVSMAGYSNPRHYNITEAQMEKAEDMMVRAAEGRLSREQIAEAFSTSDFKLAAFARIQFEMMKQYNELPGVWQQYTETVKVSDFRPQRMLDRWTDTLGLKLVPEGTEYPTAGGHDSASMFINVSKFGLKDSITWESMINNEAIGELEDLPAKLARAARETETINALSNLLTVDPVTNTAATLNTDFFKSGNSNAPDNVPLTAQNLDTKLAALQAKTSKGGQPQAAPQLQVVHPASLRSQVEKIKSLRELRFTDGSGNTTVHDNYLQVVDFVEEPMLDRIFTHAKKAGTWFILPKRGALRPALFEARLRGYENVDLRVRANAGQRPGGGQISPLEGSFDIDTIEYRARLVIGAQTGDPTYTYVSYGS